MTRLFHCQCGQRLSVPDDSTGRRGLCPKCGSPIVIPPPQEIPLQVGNGNRNQSILQSKDQHPAVSQVPKTPPPLPSHAPFQALRRVKPFLWYAVFAAVVSLVLLSVVIIPTRHSGRSPEYSSASAVDEVFNTKQKSNTNRIRSNRETGDSDLLSKNPDQSNSDKSEQSKAKDNPLVSVPPQPEMTLLAKIAPEESLFYTNFTGLTMPSADSENHVAQLFADKSVQKVVVKLGEMYTASVSDNLKKKGIKSPLAEEGVAMVKMALTHPAAAYISKIKMTSQGLTIVRGGVAIRLGDTVHDWEPKIKNFLDQILPGAKSVEIGEQKWQQVESSDAVVIWGIRGPYLLIAIGEGEIEAMQKRAKGNVPKWLVKVYQDLTVDRVTNVAYLNIKDITKLVVESNGPEAGKAIAALGLDNVTEMRYVGGLAPINFVGMTHLVIDGPPRGILQAFTETTLSAADLTRIPRNVDFAYITKFNAAAGFQSCVSAAELAQNNVRNITLFPVIMQSFENIMVLLANMDREDGLVDLRADVLKSLGDTWIVMSYPCKSPFGLVASISIRDSREFNAVYTPFMTLTEKNFWKKAAAKVADGLVAKGAGKFVDFFFPDVKKQNVNGHKVYYLSFEKCMPNLAVLPKCSWCATDKEMIFAMSLEGIRAYLTRSAGGESLAEVPVVASALKKLTPFSVSYINLPTICDRIYADLPMITQLYAMHTQRPLGIMQMPQDRNASEVSFMPPAEAIRKHLTPQISVTYRTPTGIMHVTQTTLPGLFASPTLPIVVSIVLPHVRILDKEAMIAMALLPTIRVKSFGWGATRESPPPSPEQIRRIPDSVKARFIKYLRTGLFETEDHNRVTFEIDAAGTITGGDLRNKRDPESNGRWTEGKVTGPDEATIRYSDGDATGFVTISKALNGRYIMRADNRWTYSLTRIGER